MFWYPSPMEGTEVGVAPDEPPVEVLPVVTGMVPVFVVVPPPIVVPPTIVVPAKIVVEPMIVVTPTIVVPPTTVVPPIVVPPSTVVVFCVVVAAGLVIVLLVVVNVLEGEPIHPLLAHVCCGSQTLQAVPSWHWIFALLQQIALSA
jgi:hypothetical protein